MFVRDTLEKGRSLAERIPYSFIALVSRIAVADVFWRSGQTKVSGFSIREETYYLFREEYKVPLLPPDLAAYLSTIGEHLFPILLFVGLAALCAVPAGCGAGRGAVGPRRASPGGGRWRARGRRARRTRRRPRGSSRERELVEHLMKALKPAERLVIDLLYLQQRSVAEIQKIAGWSSALVKVRAFRARQKMKKQMSIIAAREKK